MEKRSYLLLFETQNNVPNGDPFTNEQRYDNANEKIMVSDLRIKRYIRDEFIKKFSSIETIFCKYDVIEIKKFISSISKIDMTMTGSAYSFRKYLLDNGYISKIGDDITKVIKSISSGNTIDLYDLMKEFIDVRLFGGILTDTKSNCAIEGAIQFRNLSYSLNKVRTEIFQNTTVFPSEISNNQGSMGTTSLVPYSIIAVEGWLNEETARINKLTEDDIYKMLSCLWLGIRDKNSKSKSGQTPILILEIVYQEFEYKFNPAINVYKTIRNINTLVKIKSDIEDINIRSSSDYELQLDELIDKCSKDNVKSVNFFTEDEDLITKLELNSKFNFKDLI